LKFCFFKLFVDDNPDPHPHPSGGGGMTASAASHVDHSCSADGLECHNYDPSEIEAIKSLHRQLDDDDNGDIDLSESDDVSLIVSKHNKFSSNCFIYYFFKVSQRRAEI
jgi:hypothetical protein